jgi:hypothetical protein
MPDDEEFVRWCEQFAEDLVRWQQDEIEQVTWWLDMAAQEAAEAAKWPESSEQRKVYQELSEASSKRAEVHVESAQWNARTAARLRQMADDLRHQSSSGGHRQPDEETPAHEEKENDPAAGHDSTQ